MGIERRIESRRIWQDDAEQVEHETRADIPPHISAAYPFPALQESLGDIGKYVGKHAASILSELVSQSRNFAPEVLVISPDEREPLRAAFGAMPCYKVKRTVLDTPVVRTISLHGSKSEIGVDLGAHGSADQFVDIADAEVAIEGGRKIEMPPALRITFVSGAAGEAAHAQDIQDAIERCDLAIYIQSATEDLGPNAQAVIRALASGQVERTILFIDDLDQLDDVVDRVPAMHEALTSWLGAINLLEDVDVKFGSSLWASLAVHASADRLNGAQQPLHEDPAVDIADEALLWEISGMATILDVVAANIWQPMSAPLRHAIKQRASLLIDGLRVSLNGVAGGLIGDGLTSEIAERVIDRMDVAQTRAQEMLGDRVTGLSARLDGASGDAGQSSVSTSEIEALIDGLLPDIADEASSAFAAILGLEPGEADLSGPVTPVLNDVLASGPDAIVTTDVLEEVERRLSAVLSLYFADLQRQLADILDLHKRGQADLLARFGVESTDECLDVLNILADEFAVVERDTQTH